MSEMDSIDIYIMKGEEGRIMVSTSMDKIKPCIYVIPQKYQWTKISIPTKEVKI